MKFCNSVSKKDQAFLSKATELAKLSQCPYRHGAILVKGGNMIAVGINRTINPPAMLTDEVAAEHSSIHAEIAALSSVRKTNLNNAVIYVARVGRRGDQRMSRPCAKCQKALRARGIKKVYYTIDSSMDLI